MLFRTFALYSFDREIRNIYLEYLLKAENSLKSVIAHEFSRVHGHDNYLKLDSFNSSASTDPQDLKWIARSNNLTYPTDLKQIQQISAESNTASIIKLIGDIQQEIARQMSKHHQVVTHYMTHHGYIPLWVLVNVLTFGKITNFYLNMKPADKVIVAKHFSLGDRELHKFMNMLSLARNKCAHDERFFDLHTKQSIHTKSIKNLGLLGLPRGADGSYSMGTNDIYAIAIILSLLLEKSETRAFVASMNTAFSKLSKQLKVISVNDVMNVMGYPSTWSNITKLK